MIWDYFLNNYINFSFLWFKPICEILFILFLLFVGNLCSPRSKQTIIRVVASFIAIFLIINLTGGIIGIFVDDDGLLSTIILYAVYPIISIAYIFVLGIKHIRRRAINILFYYLSYLISAGIGGNFSSLMFQNSNINVAIPNITMILGNLLFIFLTLFFIIKYPIKNIKFLPNSLFVAYIFFIGINTILNQYCHLINKDVIFVLIFDLLMYLLCVVMFNLFRYVSYEYSKLLQTRMVQKEIENESILLQTHKYNDEMIHKIRHDLLNQYGYMSKLLEEKKYDELHDYFKDYSIGFKKIENTFDTGNKVVDSILSLEQSKALNFNVRLDVKTIIPNNLSISEFDLSSILFNLLDNAIEEAKKDDVETKIVHVSLKMKDELLLIQIKNPISPSNKINVNHLKTTKENKDVHGFGISIVKDLITKYDGQIMYKIEDSFFAVEAYLRCLEV